MTYKDVGIALGVSPGTIQIYLKPHPGKANDGHTCCERCGCESSSLHYHHTNYKTNAFQRLCPPCHGVANIIQRGQRSNSQVKRDKRQFTMPQALPPTPMEAAHQEVLTKAYNKAKGNISLTARSVGWSRSKTLKMLKKWDLYKLYKHDPWPERVEK